jgi:hypothetical protein
MKESKRWLVPPILLPALLIVLFVASTRALLRAPN